MTHQEIVNKAKSINHLLVSHQLKDAFDQLNQLIIAHSLGAFSSQLDELQMTYKYMLQYTVQNIKDPERKTIYNKLLHSLFQLNDQIEQQLLSLYSNQTPYTLAKTQSTSELITATSNLYQVGKQINMVALSDSPILPNDIKNKYQTYLSEVFMLLFSSSFYTPEYVSTVSSFVKDSKLKEYELAIITSAVSLSLWRNFDEQKFNALFELSTSSSELVKQRALVGLLIAIYLHNDRLPFFGKITSRFELLAENKEIIKSLESIIIQFIRSKESEKIAKRFQEEIIPEMVKLTPNIREKLDIQKNDDEGDDDKNPDWHEMLDEVPGLTDKMKEISDLQMEGADVFLSTFSMLKSFPFFNTMHNWLVPFTGAYPELSEQNQSTDIKSFVDSISKSMYLCNSDKYSFIFSMSQLPEGQRKTMTSAVGADFENLKEVEKSEIDNIKERSSKALSNQYIQDLYRFFNLHPRKKEFDNLFDHRLDFHNKTLISKLIEDTKVWENVAGYYFAKNYYSEAGELYERLLKHNNTQAEWMQKRGYCAQKLGDYDKALDYYQKADLVESNNVWTLKKIAHCHRALGQLSKAQENYMIASKLQPKNMNLQYAIANCYLGLEAYNEALNMYFKIEMNTKNKAKAWRPIAWCSFIERKTEQAEKYYAKIIENKPSAHDWINAGHVALVSHHYQTAVEYYKNAIEAFDGEIEKMLEIFQEDKPYILNYDIDAEDLPMILDKLRYEL